MKQDSNFFDDLRTTLRYYRQPPRIKKLIELYEEMSPEQQAHAGRIGAQLWSRVDTLSPMGAFELTMAILSWAERNEEIL